MKILVSIYITAAFLSCILPFAAKGQVSYGAAPFLDIPSNARTAAMGGAFAAVADEAAGAFNNPAGNVFGIHDNAISYSFSPWLRDVRNKSRFHAIGGSFRVDGLQTVSIGFRILASPEIEVTDSEGNITGTARPKDWALDFAFSRIITGNFSASLTARYISSDLGTPGDNASANAAAFDLGLYYADTFAGRGRWSAGFKLANIGTKLKYGNTGYSLPGSVRLGGAMMVPVGDSEEITLAADLDYQFLPAGVNSLGLSTGLEYGFLGYGYLRGGYRATGDNTSSYGSAGLGAAVSWFRLDFAWLIAGKESPLKNTWMLSAGAKF